MKRGNVWMSDLINETNLRVMKFVSEKMRSMPKVKKHTDNFLYYKRIIS